MVMVTIKEPTFRRGSGMWSLNRNLLLDGKCRKEIDTLTNQIELFAFISWKEGWDTYKKEAQKVFKAHGTRNASEQRECEKILKARLDSADPLRAGRKKESQQSHNPCLGI